MEADPAPANGKLPEAVEPPDPGAKERAKIQVTRAYSDWRIKLNTRQRTRLIDPGMGLIVTSEEVWCAAFEYATSIAELRIRQLESALQSAEEAGVRKAAEVCDKAMTNLQMILYHVGPDAAIDEVKRCILDLLPRSVKEEKQE